MATKTTNLQLYKVNPATDGADTFNFDTILNANWDKLDAHAATRADTRLSNLDTGALEGKVKAAIQGGSLTAGDLGAVGSNQLGKPNGVATLDGTGKVPASQLPAMNYDTKGSAKAVQDNLNTHTQDTTAHVTADERSAWNGKAAGKHASQHAANGSDPVTPAAIGAAVKYSYTATIPAAGWTSSAPYTQTISVSGVTAAMTPTVDVVQGADADAAALILDAWACVSRIDTGANKITVTCYDKAPAVNIPIQLVGVV